MKKAICIAIIIVTYVTIDDHFNKIKVERERANAYSKGLKDCIYDPYLKLSEPYFVGSTGFVIPGLEHESDFDLPWKIKTYEQTGPAVFEETTVKLPERIRAKVLEEKIINRRFRICYLTIICLDTLHNRKFIIKGENFSVLDYWNCSIEQAINTAPILATYVEGIERPVGENNVRVELSNQNLVICQRISFERKDNIYGYVYDFKNKENCYQRMTFKTNTIRALKY